MNSFTAVQYEKLILTNNLSSFKKLPIIKDTSTTELIQILNVDINRAHPFHTLKYVLAIEKKFSSLQEIYNNITRKENNNDDIF